MICRRPASKKRALMWEFVGGKVEPGETKQTALARECMEEIGVKVEVGEIFAETVHEYPDIKIRLTLFCCKLFGEPQKLEHDDIKWILPSQIPDYEFCPADESILAQITARFNSL